MKRLLVIPVVALLAVLLYVFYFYDPNSSGRETNSDVSITLGEPKEIGSSQIGASSVSDAVEFEIIPVSDPSTEDVSAAEEQPEIAHDVDGQVDPAALEAVTAGESELAVEAELTAVDEPAEVAVVSEAAVGSVEEAAVSVETGDSTGETITLVETGNVDASEGATSAGDGSQETASAQAIEEMPSQSIVVEQQPAGDYIEHKAVITSSLYQATSDAGLSANQSARIGKIFKPYLDSRRELHKGDKLVILLDSAAQKDDNDADQIHRVEFHGAKKTLIVTRKEHSLSDYEVRSADGGMLAREASHTPAIAEEQKQQPAEEVVSGNTADNNPAAGAMKRLEGVVTISLFSAAREAGLNARQRNELEKILAPYLNFAKEVRKGDRILVMLDGDVIDSCEFTGAVKKLTATRKANGSYRVTDHAGGKPADVAMSSSSDASSVSSASGEMPGSERTQPVISQMPSADEGLDDVPLKSEEFESIPGGSSETHNSDQENSTRKPFWKRFGLGSSSAVDGGSWKPKDRKLAKVFDRVAASGKVERKALIRSFKYYQENRKTTGLAQTHIAIADYTKLATTKRLHIINLKTAGVTSVQVAHGRKSGPIGGRVTSTSNANGSHQTTKGFYRVGTKEGRTSTKGLPYLSVQGLESGNRLVGLPPRKGGRDIIIHTAGYVASGGRSLGCFSIRPQDKRLVFNKLKGALFYSYVG